MVMTTKNLIWGVVYLNSQAVELELLVVAPDIPAAHKQATDWLYQFRHRGLIVRIGNHRAAGILIEGKDVTGEALVALAGLQ